jgi:hypothetical protein
MYRGHQVRQYTGNFANSLPYAHRKGIGSILFLKNGLKKFCRKTIKIILEVIIMRYVQL